MLENCTLRILLSGNNFRGNLNRTEVYRVASPSTLDIASLSRLSLPEGREKLATLYMADATHGLDWSYRFNCLMDTLHTFMLIAGDSQTDLEWWQDKQVEVPCKILRTPS